MNRIVVGLSLHFALAGPALAASSPVPERTPPNVIVILADDLGYGDISCFGNTRRKTPHLDRLAAEGMRFTDFHSDGVVCSPTRVSLLTGRYPQRMGVNGNIAPNQHGLPSVEITLPERLADATYATGMVGKWDIGYRQSPLDHGFQMFYGQREGGGDYAAKINIWGDRDWWDGNRQVIEPGYAPTLLDDRAIRFIEENAGRPFFLYVAQRLIHFPWMGPADPPYTEEGIDYNKQEIKGPRSKLGPHIGTDRLKPTVDAMVSELDRGVGRIVETVRQLGLERRTLVFFVSDNGGIVEYRGVPEHRGDISDNGPLRGQKANVYEGGHRVPAIAWWPTRVPAGVVRSDTLATRDLFPTIVELAGLPPGPAKGPNVVDGISFAPVLLGRPAPAAFSARTSFWRGGGAKAARQGDWKMVVTGSGPPELYHLGRDPGEKHDVSGDFPNETALIRRALDDWEQQVDSGNITKPRS